MILNEFEKYIPLFLSYLQCTKNISLHTKRAYKNDLEEFVDFLKKIEKQEKTSDTFAILLKRYIKYLTFEKKTNTTIARKCSSFNSFEKFMKTQGIELNLHINRPTPEITFPHILTVEEVYYLLHQMPLDLLNSQRPLRDKAVFNLLYATGLLSSEIIQLHLSQVDIPNQTLFIESAKKRTIKFNDKTREQLQNYLTFERKKPAATIEYFFLNYRDQPLTTRSIQRICNAFSKGLTRNIVITPFILRYSYAYHQIMQGISFQDLKEMLGHRCSISTERYLNFIKQLS
jgi:site-specific recombinase XerD